MSVLSSPHFHDEAKAFEYLESIVWADGVVCPHCGVVGGRVYDLSGVRTKPSKKHPKGKVRHGLKKCGECRKQFTAKVGTVFEHARLPLTKMLQAVHLMVSSKKGISAHQLSRVLEVQYKSAWFLAHRIREAMRDGDLAQPFGSAMAAPSRSTKPTSASSAAARPGRGTATSMRVVAWSTASTGQSQLVPCRQPKCADIQPIVQRQHRPRSPPDDRRSQAVPQVWPRASPSTAPRSTALATMSTGTTAPSTRTRLKARSRSSSAVCAACTSIAASSICTAIWRSSSSGTTTVPPTALMIAARRRSGEGHRR